MVVGELIPKSLAIFSTERYALATATPLSWFYRITYPVMWLFNSLTNAVVRLAGHDPPTSMTCTPTRRSCCSSTNPRKAALINPEQNEFVDNIFDLGEKDAEAIMTPRTDVICIDLEDSLAESLQKARQYNYTRYPVCRGDKDRIVGFVHVKDLYSLGADATIDDLERRARSRSARRLLPSPAC